MRGSVQLGRAVVGIMACFFILGILAGCATKGFVRTEVAELRHSMVERTDGLADELAEVRNSADQAFERAQVAYGSAVEARDMALGNLGFREVARHSVQFAFDSDQIDSPSQPTLDEVVALLQSRPDLIVDIYGFADPAGPAAYNLQLGQRRADAVQRYLVGQTVGPMNRYAAISFGEARSSRVAKDLIDSGAGQRRVAISLFERTSPFDNDAQREEDSPEFN